MSRGLTAFLRDSIDCYVSDPGVAWLHLENAQYQISAEKGTDVLKLEEKAQKRSKKRTVQALRQRLLEHPADISDGRRVEQKSPDNEWTREISFPVSYESLRERQFAADFQHVLDVLTWKESKNLADSESTSTDSGLEKIRQELLRTLTREEILEFRKCSDWDDIEQEYELDLRRLPDFEAYLTRKNLDWMDLAIGKIEKDSPITFRDSIPAHLRSYLYEAHWCDLLGFEAACAALCGAVLQEAIRVKLDVQGFTGLDEAIRDATKGEMPLLIGKAKESAAEIKKLRDSAAHGNLTFRETQEYRRKCVLPLTIEVLDTIFAPES